MTPATVINRARSEGVNLALSESGALRVTGAQSAVSRWVDVIRISKAAIIEALKADTPTPAFRGFGGDSSLPSANPYMSQRQSGEVQAFTWNDREIDLYKARIADAVDAGVPAQSADHFAELLVWRDRSSDDRRACFECVHYQHRRGGAWGRCKLLNGGGLSGRQQEFFRLRRCDGFSEGVSND